MYDHDLAELSQPHPPRIPHKGGQPRRPTKGAGEAKLVCGLIYRSKDASKARIAGYAENKCTSSPCCSRLLLAAGTAVLHPGGGCLHRHHTAPLPTPRKTIGVP